MIVRILGEGQYRLGDADVPEIDAIDERLTGAIERGDRAAFAADFAELVAHVRTQGEPTAAEHLGASDLILPPANAGFEEVRALLHAGGLVPAEP
ncbi:MAG: hypothetical protein M0Z49_12045 [Chloroflexi bacterium]|nr:hypothetical protein [Chloroflexota bacterium]